MEFTFNGRTDQEQRKRLATTKLRNVSVLNKEFPNSTDDRDIGSKEEASMYVRRCQACNSPFQAFGKDRTFVLCRNCCTECEAAYNKIYDYIRKNGEIATKDIADRVGVSNVFVLILIKEGRFREQLASESANGCKRCKSQLAPGEREMCGKCRLLLAEQLKGSINVKPAGVQNRTPERSTNRTYENKYGLRN